MATMVRMTANKLLAMPDDGYQYELIDGELVRMSPSEPIHSTIGVTFAAFLMAHVRPRRLGLVFGADAGFLLAENPDTVLSPDATFLQKDRIPAKPDRRGYWRVAPDLVVEVASPSDRHAAAAAKVARYQRYGVRMVVVVSPQERGIEVHALGQGPVRLNTLEVFDGGDVLPGFQFPVADLFDDFLG